MLCLMAAAAFGAGASALVATDARSAYGGKLPAAMPHVANPKHNVIAGWPGGPAGATEIQLDDGTLANGWYFYDKTSQYAMKLTPTMYPAMLAQADVHVLTNGDAYWPWPESNHDTFLLKVWLDQNGDGLPDEPAVLTHRAAATGVDTATVTYQPPTGSIMITSGSFFVGMREQDTNGTGYEGVAIDAATNWPNNQFYYFQGSWNMGVYAYPGDEMFRCWWLPAFQHDMATTAILVPNGTADSGAMVTPEVTVQNFGQNTETNIPVVFTMPGYSQTITIPSLGPMQPCDTTFPAGLLRARNWVTVKCSTELAGDEFNTDDKVQESIFVRIRDVMTVGFINPSGTSVDSAVPVIPEVAVKNNGTQAEGFHVRLTIVPDGYVSTESVYVQPTVTANVTFDPWTPSQRNYNTLKCSTRMDGDVIQTNDAVSRTIRVNVYDAGAAAIPAPSGMSVPPGPMNPRGTVHNYGNVAGQMPATFTIYSGGSPIYTSSNSAWVTAGASATITFDQWTATGGLYTAALQTILDGDGNSVNDTMSSQFAVLEPGHDVGVVAILAPLGVVDTLAKTPQAKVRNSGSYTENIPMTYTITDSSTGTLVYTGTTTANSVGMGETADVSFTAWGGHHPEDAYYSKCWTSLYSDGNHANDTASGKFWVQAVINDVGVKSIDVPTASLDSGTTVTPSVTVKNYGNLTTDFDVRLTIGSVYTSIAHVAGLGSGAEVSVPFSPDWLAVTRGNLLVQCTTMLDYDIYNSNDTMSESVAVNVHDVGAVQIVVPTSGIPPLTFTPQAMVRNHGTLREPCTVTFMINSTSPYSHTKSLAGLPPGVDSVVGFSDTLLPPGNYTAKCSTYEATDQVPGNEVVTSDFQVGTFDVGATAIIAPVSTDTATVITPSATVHNFASISTSFPVHFVISTATDGVVYTGDTTVNNLAGGSSTTATFPVWAKPHALGDYVAKCSTEFAGDGNQQNDAVTSLFSIAPTVVTGAWTELLNIPVNFKNKRVKDGAALAYQTGISTNQYIYALKGNNTYEFYRYTVGPNTWVTQDSIPAYNSNLKKKAVKKGSSMAYAGDGNLYATKGNNTDAFWQYDPLKPDGTHWTEMANEVPTGTKACREGTSMAAVTVDGTNYIYFLKGSGTYEFYRYDVAAKTWDLTLPPALPGASGRPYKVGSSIAYDGGDTIYCLKGSYNEFFAYSISNRNWVTLETLPRRIPGMTKKTKVKAGSELAVAGRTVYTLKGANTNEFWTYLCDSHRWYHGTDMPTMLKKVNGGGALVASTSGRDLYAFRGNNTLEFWQYTTASSDMLAGNEVPKDVMGNTMTRAAEFALRIAPNPFAGAAHISYSVPKAGNVSLKLYDVTGKLVKTLVQGYATVGSHATGISAEKLASGIYLLKYESAGEHTTQKLIVQ
jgi:hypothetical protein